MCSWMSTNTSSTEFGGIVNSLLMDWSLKSVYIIYYIQFEFTFDLLEDPPDNQNFIKIVLIYISDDYFSNAMKI